MADTDPQALQEAIEQTQLVEPILLRSVKEAIEGLQRKDAILIKSDSFEVIKRPRWKDMKSLINCSCVECVSLPCMWESSSSDLPREMWVDEEGKMEPGWERRVNPLATNLVQLQDLIVGNAIVVIGDV